MGIGSIVGGVISAGTKLLGNQGVQQAVGQVANAVGGSQAAGGSGQSQDPKEIAKKMMIDSFVSSYKEQAEKAQAEVEKELKKGDPGAVK